MTVPQTRFTGTLAPVPGRPRGLARAGSVLIAVGDSGGIWSSDDEGDHWNTVPSGTDATLRAVAFVDERVGLAVGDGGSYPAAPYPPPPGHHLLLDLQQSRLAAASLPGFSVEPGLAAQGLPLSTVLTTRDGGRSWTRVVPPTNFPLTGVAWRDATTAMICTGDITSRYPHDGDLLITHDAGATWQRCLQAWRPLLALALTSELGFAVGHAKAPPRLTLEGVVVPAEGPQRLAAITAHFPVEQRELLLSPMANAIHLEPVSLSGVQAWHAHPLSIGGQRLQDVCLLGHAGVVRAWVVGDAGLAATSVFAAGSWGEWSHRSPSPKASWQRVVFADACRGLLLDQEGGCWSTVDAGMTWAQERLVAGSPAAGAVIQGAQAIILHCNGGVSCVAMPMHDVDQ